MDLGVIVAGGKGERLHPGTPKSEVVLAGETLLERATFILAAVCDPVVVVTPRARRPDLERAATPVVEWVEDAPAGEGPLSGIVAGLAAEPFDRAIVLGVDFPLVRSSLLRFLLAELESSGATAVVPAPGGVPQPLIAAYAPRAAQSLCAAYDRGERSVTRAVATLEPRMLDDAWLTRLEGGMENFLNVNTPEELAEAERLIGERRVHRRAVRRAARRSISRRPR